MSDQSEGDWDDDVDWTDTTWAEPVLKTKSTKITNPALVKSSLPSDKQSSNAPVLATTTGIVYNAQNLHS